MNFFGDYHIHTDYSDGRATLEEMIEAASLKGLEEIGISDHGPNNIGTGVKASQTYLKIKEEVKKLSSYFPSTKILVGAEANIIGLKGEIDISPTVLKELDYVMIGLHPYVRPKNLQAGWHYVLGNQTAQWSKGLKEKAKNINTKTLIEGLYKNDCLAITHPGLKMEIDFIEIAQACVKTNTALEINTSHRFPGVKEVLEVSNSGVSFIVNSDAHFPESVGNFEFGSYVLEKAKIPPERVYNAIN